jgi:aspartate 1-decarboxylase
MRSREKAAYLMLRTMCRVKIHRATLNEADLNYVGSVTIPTEIMEALDILEGEQCDVLNITTGARLTT